MQIIDVASALQRLHEIECMDKRNLSGEKHIQLEREVQRCKNELPAELVSKYYLLKKKFGRTAVSLLKNKRCMGCFISLPIDFAPVDGDVYVCEHCGRLLIDADAVYEF